MDLRKLDIDKIYSAFSPAKEISDPKLFAGRREEIRNGILGLLNCGGFLAIYGLRSVGKSSIVYRFRRLPKVMEPYLI